MGMGNDEDIIAHSFTSGSGEVEGAYNYAILYGGNLWHREGQLSWTSQKKPWRRH